MGGCPKLGRERKYAEESGDQIPRLNSITNPLCDWARLRVGLDSCRSLF